MASPAIARSDVVRDHRQLALLERPHRRRARPFVERELAEVLAGALDPEHEVLAVLVG